MENFENFEIFEVNLEYFSAIRHSLWPLGNFEVTWYTYCFPVLVYCAKKNLATLVTVNQLLVDVTETIHFDGEKLFVDSLLSSRDRC
jgi:hypothetical protein